MVDFSMKRTLIALIAFAAALFPSPSRAQAPLQRAVITYSSRSIASIDLFIAQERGFFREEGIDPQLVQISANAAIAATVSGDVHALGSVGSAIRAIQRGVPIKVLAVSLRRPLFWLVTDTSNGRPTTGGLSLRADCGASQARLAARISSSW